MRLLCGSGGDLSLSAAFKDGDLEYLTPTTFRCRKGAALRADDARDALHLLVPTIPSPHHLCEMLTEAAKHEELRKVALTPNPRNDIHSS